MITEFVTVWNKKDYKKETKNFSKKLQSNLI